MSLPPGVLNPIRQARHAFEFHATDIPIAGLTTRSGHALTLVRAAQGCSIDTNGRLLYNQHTRPRVEMFDTDGDLVREYAALRIENAHTNLCADLGSWALSNVTRTTGQSDPLGGTGACLLDATAAAGFAAQTVTVTDGTKATGLHIKKGTAAVVGLGFFDATAGGGTWRSFTEATWNGSVPVLSTPGGYPGTPFSVEALADGWYAIGHQSASIVGVNTNKVYLYPGNGATTGSVYAYGPGVYNAATLPRYGPTTTAMDHISTTLDLPYTSDQTWFVEISRPTWASLAGDLVLSQHIVRRGGSPLLELFCPNSNRYIGAYINNGVGSITQYGSIQAGALLRVCAQFRNLATDPQCRISDGGAGAFTAWTTAGTLAGLTDLTAELYIGSDSNPGSCLSGGLGKLIMASGLYTYDQMQRAVG